MAKAKKEEAEKKDAEEAEAKPEGAAEGAAEGAPAEGAEGAPAEGGGGGKKKLLIIIGGVVVLLIGAGAGLYFTGMLDSLLGKEAPVECAEGDHECEEAAKAAAEHGEKADAKGGHGEKKEAKGGGGGHGEAAGGASDSFVAIPTMIVNLNSDDGTPRYLRLTVQLELEDSADKAAVEAIIPKVIDQFQTYLRELRVRDLRGSGGIYRLQMELLWRVNQAAAPVEVKDVLFQEILIQ
ncbi:MAG TPA: flagellar basal body-associated FliL family protein [Alphaproteobacteria bacterium]|nr:flagellar basal body-associated FliL family protein [Micavibrio sp.]MBK9561627.1 flagellar basal body-associated FliL family protein [Micavibrio sp.]HQX26910.1 flagellar basal body-associated FliL family protein [Alphaproteobacteria bacterium]